jgi:hypothetical protein
MKLNLDEKRSIRTSWILFAVAVIAALAVIAICR